MVGTGTTSVLVKGGREPVYRPDLVDPSEVSEQWLLSAPDVGVWGPSLPSEEIRTLESFHRAQQFWNSLGTRFPSLRTLSEATTVVKPQVIVGAHRFASIPHLAMVAAMSEQGRDALAEFAHFLAPVTDLWRERDVCQLRCSGLAPVGDRAVFHSQDLMHLAARSSAPQLATWFASLLKRSHAHSREHDIADHLLEQIGVRSLRCLSYNVMGLPWALGLGAGKSWRFDRIGRLLREYGSDIVALQEMFSKKTARIQEIARYPFVAQSHATHGKLGLIAGSGLMILSRYPITWVEEYTFKNRMGVERAARKGLLLVTIQSPLGEIDVLTGHFCSPPEGINRVDPRLASACRLRQIQDETAAFLKAHRGKTSRPLISLGDFNCDERDQEFVPLCQLLGADTHLERYSPRSNINFSELNEREQEMVAGPTFDPFINRFARGKLRGPARLDHVHVKGLDLSSLFLRSRRLFSGAEVLSDHCAVEASLAHVG